MIWSSEDLSNAPKKHHKNANIFIFKAEIWEAAKNMDAEIANIS